MKTPARPQGRRAGRSPASKSRTGAALGRLAPDERAAVLEALLGRHPDLRDEAERIAVELLSTSSAEEVAEEVCEALESLGLDALNGRAGRQAWGYVEPTEAAWELLHEAVEGFLADMERRMELGLTESAEILCRGIVAGLHRAADPDSAGLLGWAPDFPLEEACRAVVELLRTCPKEKRAQVCDRLLAAIGEEAPVWSDTVGRAATRAVREK